MTIKDLSFMTGYSISTVSKALNNKGDISVNTKKEIVDVAKKYNYSPNKLAVSLRLKKTKSLAVILPCLTINCYSQALHGIQKHASKQGYQTILYQSCLNGESIKSILDKINNGLIDGVIILSSEDIELNHLNYSMPIQTERFCDEDDNDFIDFKSKVLFENLIKRFIY